MFRRKKETDQVYVSSPHEEELETISNLIKVVFDPNRRETPKRIAERAGESINTLLGINPDLALSVAGFILSAIEDSVRPKKRLGGVLGKTNTINAKDVKIRTHHLLKLLTPITQRGLLSSIAQDPQITARFQALAGDHYIRQDLLTAYNRILQPSPVQTARLAVPRTAQRPEGNKQKRNSRPVSPPPKSGSEACHRDDKIEPEIEQEPAQSNNGIREVRVCGEIFTTEVQESTPPTHARAVRRSEAKETFGDVASAPFPYDEYVVQALIANGIPSYDITRYSPDDQRGYKLIVADGYDGQIAISAEPNSPTFVIRNKSNIAEEGPVDTSALRDDPFVWRIDRRGSAEDWAERVVEHFMANVQTLEVQNKRYIKWPERTMELKDSFIETTRIRGRVSFKDGTIMYGPLAHQTTWNAAYLHLRRKYSQSASSRVSVFDKFAWELVDEGYELFSEVPHTDDLDCCSSLTPSSSR